MNSNGANVNGAATQTQTPDGSHHPDSSDLPPPDEIAAAIGDLPALPDIALRVLRLTDGEDWSGADLAEEICRDPGLTARFLRAANSAHYGVRRTIGSPNQALTMLGSKKVRTTLLAASVEGLLQADRSNFEDRALWRRAFATACVSEQLATATESCNPEDAYIAGLLHDIGRSLMDERFTDRYGRVVGRVSESGESFSSAETEVFGFTHTEVGFLVTSAWGLPDPLTETIRWHHHPGAAVSDVRLCATVSMANDWCVKNGVGPKTESDLEIADLAGAKILGWDAARVDELTDGLMPIVERALSD